MAESQFSGRKVTVCRFDGHVEGKNMASAEKHRCAEHRGRQYVVSLVWLEYISQLLT